MFAHEDDLPPLDDGEVYLHDLIGLAVFEVGEDEQPHEAPLGTVRDVLEGGAQLLFAVARKGESDVLVPDVPEIVRAIDLDAGYILVALPDGLLD